MKQSFTIVLGAAALAAGSSGLAASQSAGGAGGSAALPAPLPPVAFLAAVERSNDAEIADARYVLRFTKDPKVRTFAEQMIQDHAQANVVLQSAARRANVPAPRSLRVAAPANLVGLTEPQLDRTYMQGQVQAHKAALGVLNAESAAGQNAELKQFAAAQAPIVQQHLDNAANYLTEAPNSLSPQPQISVPYGGVPGPHNNTTFQTAPSAAPSGSGAPAGASAIPSPQVPGASPNPQAS